MTKKDIKRRKTVNAAKSINNGIIFFVNEYDDLAVHAYYDDKNRIIRELVRKDELADAEIEEKFLYRKTIQVVWLITLVINAILLVTMILKPQYFEYCFVIILLIIYLYMSRTVERYIVLFANIINFKTKNGKDLSTGRFHSAEHMVIDAYEKKQKVPTLEEVRQESRFSKKCGSLVLFNQLFYNTIFSIAMIFILLNGENIINFVQLHILTNIGLSNDIMLVFFSALIYFFIAISTAMIVYITQKYSLLRFMEVLVTNKPTDKELSLAIEGIKYWDKIEDLWKI